MLKRFYANTQKGFDTLLGIIFCLMAFFLLGNVVLRYFFNSGLTWAEELSRFLFVWITFLGAIGALKEDRHLGFTGLVKKLPLPLQKLCFLLSNGIILYLLYLVFKGSASMFYLGLGNVAPATGLPLAVMWLVGLVFSLAMFAIVAWQLYCSLFRPEEKERP